MELILEGTKAQIGDYVAMLVKSNDVFLRSLRKLPNGDKYRLRAYTKNVSGVHPDEPAEFLEAWLHEERAAANSSR
jgi:hypothetical protein